MPTRFIPYIIENFLVIKNIFLLALIASFPTSLFEQLTGWVIINQVYIQIIFGVILLDLIFGSLVHAFWKKDFSILKCLTGLGLKLTVMLAMGSLFEALSHLTIEEDWLYSYLRMITRLMVFSYPFRSVMINCYIMTDGRFPPKILIDGFTKFNNTLDITEIVNKKSFKRPGEQVDYQSPIEQPLENYEQNNN